MGTEIKYALLEKYADADKAVLSGHVDIVILQWTLLGNWNTSAGVYCHVVVAESLVDELTAIPGFVHLRDQTVTTSPTFYVFGKTKHEVVELLAEKFSLTLVEA